MKKNLLIITICLGLALSFLVSSKITLGRIYNPFDLWNKAASDIYYNAGNVGIGTDSPDFSLEVDGIASMAEAYIGIASIKDTASGNVDFANNLALNIGNAGTDFTSTGGLVLAGQTSMSEDWELDADASISGRLDLAGAASIAGDFQVDATDNVFYVDTVTNQVGIGTTGPSEKLHITGDVAVGSQNLYLDYNSPTADRDVSIYFGDDGSNTAHSIHWDDGDAMFKISDGGLFIPADTTIQFYSILDMKNNRIYDVSRLSAAAGSNLQLDAETTGDILIITDSDSDFNVGSGQLFVQGSNGNVGIGTTGPDYKLSVDGTASVSDDLTVDGGASVSGNFWVDTNTLFVDSTNNEVGIGTTDASSSLHLWSETATQSMTITTGTLDRGGKLILQDDDGVGCTSITAANGVLTAVSITCP